MKIIRFVLCLQILFSGWVFAKAETLFSPDKKVKLVFDLKNGEPYYSIYYNNKIIIKPSALGFYFKQDRPLVDNFILAKAETFSFDETWKPVWGTREQIRNHYNQLLVKLIEKTSLKREMHLVFRAFNDGIGFRYLFPKQSNLKKIEIVSEETRFHFSGNYLAWWIPADFDSYEHLYRQTYLNDIQGANTPLTIKTKDKIYISIHEADLTDYAGMTLLKDEDRNNSLKVNLVPWPDGIKVKTEVPCQTPWRTIQIADKPGGLIESYLILNLNEPCVIKDTSWIKPMKYMGIWWGMHINKYSWGQGLNHGATTENARYYIDFASEHNIPGLLIEGWNTGWENWGKEGAYNFTNSYSDFNLQEVVAYARKRGVVIIGHHETGGDVPTYEQQMDAAFALYKRLGVPAVKTGYAGKIRPIGQHHHGQWMVNHYRKVLLKAAENQIMIDAHEPIKPTGISRTYPNMMTREGARGMEYNAWSDGNPPEHTTILPFTRLLAGPLDYTPGIFDILFDQYKKKERVYSTLANQLALFVVIFSPLQMAADLPENYKDQPAFAFIENVPVNWDDTRVINAEIGDYITIARKNKDQWFIGSITDEESRTLKIPLDFLEANKEYTATIYADAADADWNTKPLAIEIKKKKVNKKTVIKAYLAPGGGQAIEIKPE